MKIDRERLIAEVKREYQRLYEAETKDSFIDLTSGISPDAYYENLLDNVVKMIEQGYFDGYKSGKQVVEAVANGRIR
ncbi:MAG: hypothetical protein GX196_06555 [Clostridiaceae bacterium]|nr:hypothetical protein [Clostridiaceae bacterium]